MIKASKHMRSDEKGVSATVEYILTFVIASGIFTLLVLNFNSLFIESPQYIVTRNQMADIGNDVSTKVIDTYLVAPDEGSITTYFDIPTTVAAGYTYDISVEEITGKDPSMEERVGKDRVVVIHTSNGIYVNTTLSGASLTIPIRGKTSSTSYLHNVVYDTNAV